MWIRPQTCRKVAIMGGAIEPAFDLISKLLVTHSEHKPLPVSVLAAVSTFLTLGVLILQLAMLMHVRGGLPTRNVTHIKTVFQLK